MLSKSNTSHTKALPLESDRRSDKKCFASAPIIFVLGTTLFLHAPAVLKDCCRQKEGAQCQRKLSFEASQTYGTVSLYLVLQDL